MINKVIFLLFNTFFGGSVAGKIYFNVVHWEELLPDIQ